MASLLSVERCGCYFLLGLLVVVRRVVERGVLRPSQAVMGIAQMALVVGHDELNRCNVPVDDLDLQWKKRFSHQQEMKKPLTCCVRLYRIHVRCCCLHLVKIKTDKQTKTFFIRIRTVFVVDGRNGTGSAVFIEFAASSVGKSSSN